MRRTMGVLAVATALVLGAAACGGSEEPSSTTAPNSVTQPEAGGSVGPAVGAYCEKVNELADLVARGRGGSGDFDAELRRLSDELRDLSNEAAKSLSTNPAAAKKFGECSLTASKKIAESFQPG